MRDSTTGSEPVSSRPNVLWVIADQWRAQATGYSGEDPNARTPNLDALARQAMNCRRALSAHPLCVPFRGALLTGQYSHVNGVTGHYSSLPANAVTVGHDLADAGYTTAWFGKWHLYEHTPPEGGKDAEFVANITVPAERRGGFEHWEAFEGGNIHIDPWVHTHEDPTPQRRSGYQPEVLVDAFQQYVEQRNDERPWFAVISSEPPHDPYDVVPEEFRRRYRPEEIELRPNVPRCSPVEEKARSDLAGYYAHIEATDAAVGRLLRWLDERGLAENTIVFFFADHGDMLGSHGLYMKTRPLEESIRVPLLVRWPERVPAGGTTDVFITEVDFIPTIRGLLDLPSRPGLQGQDLSRVLLGEEDVDARPWAFLQYVEPHGHANATRLPWRAIRTADAMYGCTPGQEEWVYDLAEDPYETRNLALVGGARPLRERLRPILQSALELFADPFELPAPSEPEHGEGKT